MHPNLLHSIFNYIGYCRWTRQVWHLFLFTLFVWISKLVKWSTRALIQVNQTVKPAIYCSSVNGRLLFNSIVAVATLTQVHYQFRKQMHCALQLPDSSDRSHSLYSPLCIASQMLAYLRIITISLKSKDFEGMCLQFNQPRVVKHYNHIGWICRTYI